MTATPSARLSSLPPRLRARDVAVIRSGRWVVGRVCSADRVPAWREDGLGRPGLWNRVSPPDDTPVFAWPASAFDALRAVTDKDPTDEGVARLYRSWMAKTCTTSALSRWRAPSPATVHETLAGKRLVVRGGVRAHPIQPEVEAHRLALTCAVLPHMPSTLAEARFRWVDRLKHSAVERHPCVRLGWRRTEDGRAMTAEVDLSGAPMAWIATLLVQALAEMRQCLEPLLEPIELLANETEQDLQFLAIPQGEERSDETSE